MWLQRPRFQRKKIVLLFLNLLLWQVLQEEGEENSAVAAELTGSRVVSGSAEVMTVDVGLRELFAGSTFGVEERDGKKHFVQKVECVFVFFLVWGGFFLVGF